MFKLKINSEMTDLDTPIVNIHSLVETPDPPEEWTSYFNLNDFENEHRDEETQKTRSKARLCRTSSFIL
jgi:hypothetical protein